MFKKVLSKIIKLIKTKTQKELKLLTTFSGRIDIINFQNFILFKNIYKFSSEEFNLNLTTNLVQILK